MNLSALFLAPFFLFAIGTKATISRSPHLEMKKLREVEDVRPAIHLDEFWPFPKTIGESDPFLYELEEQLLGLNMES